MKKLLIVSFVLSLVTSTAYADQYVNGYYRSNGTYVNGYYRTTPDNNIYNNYSTKGNINPYTGVRGTVNPYNNRTSFSNNSFCFSRGS